MQNREAEIPNLKSESRPASRLTALAATLWVALFLVGFFSVEFATNPVVYRWQLWSLIPELIDFVDPPVTAGPNSGWRFFPQRFDLVAVAATILAGAWGTGHLLLRVLRLPLPKASLERTVFAFGLGLSALSLATLGAGLVGWLSRAGLAALIALSIAAEICLRLTRKASPPAASGGSAACFSPPAPLSAGHWVVLATLIPFILATLLGALLPSTDFDVNAYHFEGPKEFYQAGRVSFLEHNVYTSFPFGTEMLTLLAMVLEGDWNRGALAGKCLLMCFGPLTGMALFSAGRRWFGNTAGVLAAVFYISTPWIYRISTIAYAEGGLCFYLFATLLAVMLAGPRVCCRSEDAAERNQIDENATARLVVLAGVLAGSGMACKYPALVSIVVPLFAWVAWIGVRRWGRRGWILPAAFLAGTLVAVGPWLLKNAVETGNPVYPLAYRVFGGRDWDQMLDARWTRHHSPPTFSLSSLVELATEIAARSKWQSALLFGFAPLALCGASKRRRAAWLWLYAAWLFLSCWLFTHRIDRFWVPMLPVVALLAGVGASWNWETVKNGLSPIVLVIRPPQQKRRSAWFRADVALGRGVVIFLVAGLSLFNLELIVGERGLCGYNDYLRNLDDAERYAENLRAPELMYLNEHLPEGSKVLAVGDGAMFEARIPVVYNTVFDHSIFEEWLAARPGEHSSAARLRDAAEIRQKLADEGITHIYVNWLWILRYRSPGNYGYTDFVTPERFVELQRLGILGQPLPIPNAALDVNELEPDWRAELKTWGRGLVIRQDDKDEFVTFQVFPVVR